MDPDLWFSPPAYLEPGVFQILTAFEKDGGKHRKVFPCDHSTFYLRGSQAWEE